jgi:UDP-3-O-[3-hydroxymyristoyl] glucosamine N-acyltransferase
MSLTLREIAALVGGTLTGDGHIVITGANIIRDATRGEITFAEGEQALKQLASCSASAVLVAESTATTTLPQIQVPQVHAAFAKIVTHFRPAPRSLRRGLSPAAHISPTARLAEDVEVAAGVTIGDDVEIGAGCTIHSGVVIMSGARIGAGTTIFPNCVLYEHTIVGPECILHAGAILGAYGFGYSFASGRHEISAQLGYVELGPRVEVGAATTIDRGTYGATYIGEGTKIDNQVMIAHNVRLGKHNLICSQVGIAGSSSTGDYVVLAGQVGIRDHVHIGHRAKIGAKGGVMNDVPADAVYVGIPAGPEREYFQSLIGLTKIPQMRKEFKELKRKVAQLEEGSEGERRGEAA